MQITPEALGGLGVFYGGVKIEGAEGMHNK
jgi:hypothetical protein